MPIVQPFPPRAGFVTQGVDGAFVLTADAYRFLRDALGSLGGGTTSSIADFDVLSQFADSQPAGVAQRAEYAERIAAAQQSPDAQIAELTRRVASLESLLAVQPDATARLTEAVKSGTYVPTLFNTTNVTASTAYTCQYVRLRNIALVSGRVDIQPTAAAATATLLGMSLPIPSTLSAPEMLGGTAASNTVNQSIATLGDTVNNRATFRFASASTVNMACYFSFAYRIRG